MTWLVTIETEGAGREPSGPRFDTLEAAVVHAIDLTDTLGRIGSSGRARGVHVVAEDGRAELSLVVVPGGL